MSKIGIDKGRVEFVYVLSGAHGANDDENGRLALIWVLRFAPSGRFCSINGFKSMKVR